MYPKGRTFKPSRWISRHSLHHNLAWKIYGCSFSPFKFFFQLLFGKNPDSFFSCYSFCCNKIFHFSFCLKLLVFFLCRILSQNRLLSNNFLSNKRTNGNRRKNCSCVTIGWEVFLPKLWRKRMQTLYFSIEVITFPFILNKYSVKESRRLYTNCIWPQWTMCCMQSWT